MQQREILREEFSRIAAFGVELCRVEEEDLPLLCYWRNQPEILPFMNDTRPVTLEVLRFWLMRAYGGDTVWPYIARINGEPVGYTELTNVDWFHKSAEIGIFLFGKRWFSAGVSYRVVLCREIVVDRLGLKNLISRIRPANDRNVRFCKSYGGEYVRTEGDFLVYTLEQKRRLLCLKAIAAALGMAEEYSHFF